MRAAEAPFVKVCGLTDLATIRLVETLGAEYIGLIVEVSRSPRSLPRAHASILARATRARPVMVTTSTDPEEIAELAGSVQPAVVQVHGEQALVGEVKPLLEGVEVWQVVGVPLETKPDSVGCLAVEGAVRDAVAAGADKVLLDSAKGGRSGGTGEAMDWEVARNVVGGAADALVVLAGGLTPGNVAQATETVRPAGVDVSSGVETAPNVKSPALIREFLRAVRQVT